MQEESNESHSWSHLDAEVCYFGAIILQSMYNSHCLFMSIFVLLFCIFCRILHPASYYMPKTFHAIVDWSPSSTILWDSFLPSLILICLLSCPNIQRYGSTFPHYYLVSNVNFYCWQKFIYTAAADKAVICHKINKATVDSTLCPQCTTNNEYLLVFNTEKNVWLESMQ